MNTKSQIRILTLWKSKNSYNTIQVEESNNKYVKVRKTNVKKSYLKSLFTYPIEKFLKLYEPVT